MVNSWNQVQPSFSKEEDKYPSQKYSSRERRIIEEVNDPNRLRNKQHTTPMWREKEMDNSYPTNKSDLRTAASPLGENFPKDLSEYEI